MFALVPLRHASKVTSGALVEPNQRILPGGAPSAIPASTRSAGRNRPGSRTTGIIARAPGQAGAMYRHIQVGSVQPWSVRVCAMRGRGVFGGLLAFCGLSACTGTSGYTVSRVEVAAPSPAIQCGDAPCPGPNVRFLVRGSQGSAKPACTVFGSYNGKPFAALSVSTANSFPASQQSPEWVGIAILRTGQTGIRAKDLTVRCHAGDSGSG